MVAGIFTKSRELKHEAEMAKIQLERDIEDRIARSEEREHEMDLLELQGRQQVQHLQIDMEGRAELEALQGRAQAQQGEFANLKTGKGMDNFRASIRPAMAVWYTIAFSAFLGWAFFSFSDQITPEQGGEILFSLFVVLEFMVTGVGGFYFGHRRSSQRSPKL